VPGDRAVPTFDLYPQACRISTHVADKVQTGTVGLGAERGQATENGKDGETQTRPPEARQTHSFPFGLAIDLSLRSTTHRCT
jgi:hypothetical protein